MADNIHWRKGDKFAFIDFNGIKDIPISINNKELINTTIKNK